MSQATFQTSSLQSELGFAVGVHFIIPPESLSTSLEWVCLSLLKLEGGGGNLQ